MRIADLADGRDNNFNLIRMIAAFSVLVSHAYPIARGTGAAEPLQASLGVSLGTVGVLVFFGISGFLILRSYDRSSSVWRWGIARVLRLFPALVIVLLLTALVLGPLVTRLPLGTYATDPATLSYVPRNLSLWALQYPLPGVFETNPLPGAINGSLWTLVHEVLCYLGILLVGLAGILRSRAVLVASVFAYGAFYLGVIAAGGVVELPGRILSFHMLSFAFAVGAAFYLFRDRIRLDWRFAVGLAALAWVTNDTVLGLEIFTIALTYGVFCAAYLIGGPIRRYNALGDYSYGIYIYAFPSQQLVAWWLGPHDPLTNMILSTLLVLPPAILSWHLVEEPALGRKDAVAGWLARWRRS